MAKRTCEGCFHCAACSMWAEMAKANATKCSQFEPNRYASLADLHEMHQAKGEKLVRLSDVEYYLRKTALNIINDAEQNAEKLTDMDKQQIGAAALALCELADNAHRLPGVEVKR